MTASVQNGRSVSLLTNTDILWDVSLCFSLTNYCYIVHMDAFHVFITCFTICSFVPFADVRISVFSSNLRASKEAATSNSVDAEDKRLFTICK